MVMSPEEQSIQYLVLDKSSVRGMSMMMVMVRHMMKGVGLSMVEVLQWCSGLI